MATARAKGDRDGVFDGVTVGVVDAMGERETLVVIEIDGVLDDAALLLRLGETEAVAVIDGVGEIEGVLGGVALVVGLGEREGVAVTEGEGDVEGVLDGVALLVGMGRRRR